MISYTLNSSSQDFLFFALGIGFLILVGFLSYAAYNIAQTFKQSTSILIKVDDITKDVEDFKDFIKYGILYLKDIIFKKGGEKKK